MSVQLNLNYGYFVPNISLMGSVAGVSGAIFMIQTQAMKLIAQRFDSRPRLQNLARFTLITGLGYAAKKAAEGLGMTARRARLMAVASIVINLLVVIIQSKKSILAKDTRLDPKVAKLVAKMKPSLEQVRDEAKGMQVGLAGLQGLRPSMEDAHIHGKFPLPNGTKVPFFGLYDGHGGDQVAHALADQLHFALMEGIYSADLHKDRFRKEVIQEFNRKKKNYVEYSIESRIVKRELKKTFERLNKNLKKEMNSGSTALISWIKDNKLWVANVGDSRAVLAGKGARELSEDAKPILGKFQKRIHKEGGMVNPHNYRVNGILAVARAFGDRNIGPGISCSPKVVFLYMDQVEKGDILILACDGIWDVMSSHVAATFVQSKRVEGKSLNEIANLLAEEAIKQGSTDNCSVMLIDPNDYR